MAITRPISAKAVAMAKMPISWGDSSRARMTKTTKVKAWSEAMRQIVHNTEVLVLRRRSSV